MQKSLAKTGLSFIATLSPRNSFQVMQTSVPPSPHKLRSPDIVMRLERMGSFHPMRLSFSRILLRRMAAEGWVITTPIWSLDKEGYGHAVITATTPNHTYSLIAYSHPLADGERSDRVIAERWDTTFTLIDGIPDDSDIEFLAHPVANQESGRHRQHQLTLSRANKSVRIFNHVVQHLAQGQQPDAEMVNKIGYLMRTTAVYGNGKFGIGDRHRLASRPEMHAPFQVEMLTVYLIREFSLHLVNHLAKMQGKSKATELAPHLARHLGIGNATGLGMAPFLINHQALLHQWMLVRETARARIVAQPTITEAEATKIEHICTQAQAYTAEWKVDDTLQSGRIKILQKDLKTLATMLKKDWWQRPHPLQYIVNQKNLSLEAQEMIVSILMEPFGHLIDDLSGELSVQETHSLPAELTVGQIKTMIGEHYAWVSDIDINAPSESAFFWYISEAKLEPRLGKRHEEEGADQEMPFDIPKQITALMQDLKSADAAQPIASFMHIRPQHRFIIKRIITTATHPYGEIKENLVGSTTRPIDMLRCKLSFFGASKFDPKSTLWTRISLYHGAPLANEITTSNADSWLFPSIGAS